MPDTAKGVAVPFAVCDKVKIMETQQLIEYCLQKKGAYTDFPFGEDVTCLKVKKKLFAQFFILKGGPMMTVNCERLAGEFFRNAYPDAVTRGYHCPPVQQPYFNTVRLWKDIPENDLLGMIDHSYSYVTGKLPKKIQKELEEE